MAHPNQGEGHGQHKLTAADVRAIRDAYAAGESVRVIARRYPAVAEATVCQAISGHTWQHSRTVEDAAAYTARKRQRHEAQSPKHPRASDAQIRCWHRRGSSVQRIAQATGLGTKTIWAILGNPPVRSEPLTQREVHLVIRRWSTGEYSLTDLSHQFGVTRERIRQITSAQGHGGNRRAGKLCLNPHAALYIRTLRQSGADTDDIAQRTGYSAGQIEYAGRSQYDVAPKACPRCRRDSTQTLFRSDRSRADGAMRLCRDCQGEAVAAWYRRNRETHIAAVTQQRRNRRPASL